MKGPIDDEDLVLIEEYEHPSGGHEYCATAIGNCL
jgi:hypothetical protein